MKFKTLLSSILVSILYTQAVMAVDTHASVASAIPSKSAVPSSQSSTQIPASSEEDTGRIWNLQDADILSVINEVSSETGKNFIVDPRVNGKISLVSSKALPRDQVYPVFLSVLSMLGFSAIPTGTVVKIVPTAESLENATRVVSNKNLPQGDEVVVRVVPLDNINATQLIPVLRPLLPQWSNIAAYTPANILLLSGRASNLERILVIIREIDRVSNNRIEVIPLKYASASQIANVLNNLQNAARMSGDSNTVSIATDERSNSILLGGNKVARLKMRILLAQLDAPSQTPEGNTEVVYLRYQEAKTLAPILSKIAQNILGKGTDAASAVVASTNTTSTNSSKEATLTNIQADQATNSVIITASPALMQALRHVIAKLDIRPAQVLVEAIIAEIDETNLQTLGIRWGSNLSINSTGTAAGNIFNQDNYGIIPQTSVQAILTALQNQVNANILSTPSVVVLDNREAVIEVGEQINQQTGSYATSNNVSTVSPYTTNQYKDITLKLKVKPQINLGEAVRLNLDLKNDSLVDPASASSQTNPPINTNKITNSVIVNTGDVLVLGGLMSDNHSETLHKVPILGDIPLIGKVFQNKTNSITKRNLVLFIKPSIIRTPLESSHITENKYETVRQDQMNWMDQKNKTRLSKPAVLPPWKATKTIPNPFEEKA